MITRTVEGEVSNKNLEGLGEQAPLDNMEDGTCDSRRYWVEAEKMIRNSLNSPEVTGDIQKLIEVYFREYDSWFKFVGRVVPFIARISSVGHQSKRWNSQLGSSQKQSRDAQSRKGYEILQHAWDKKASATMRKVVDGAFSFDKKPQALPAVVDVEKFYRGKLEHTFEYRWGTIG